jgi:hypothetical protein
MMYAKRGCARGKKKPKMSYKEELETALNEALVLESSMRAEERISEAAQNRADKITRRIRCVHTAPATCTV